MKEIKFRAWDGGAKKMSYIPVWYFSLNVVGLGMGEEAYEIGLNHVKVMQFTGLRDKNGKEIYEGDIVRIYSDFYEEREAPTQQVEWSNGYFCKDDFGNDYLPPLDYPGFELEIIGNIYENPELLKV